MVSNSLNLWKFDLKKKINIFTPSIPFNKLMILYYQQSINQKNTPVQKNIT